MSQPGRQHEGSGGGAGGAPRGARAVRGVCSVARAARGLTSLAALRRRLPALPHHASAGRVARAAGQAREPATVGRVAGGLSRRAGLHAGTAGGAGCVRLLPLVRERARAQPPSDPRESAGEARLCAGAEHDGPAAAAGAGRLDAALRAPAAADGRAGRCARRAHARHAHRARRVPRPHR